MTNAGNSNSGPAKPVGRTTSRTQPFSYGAATPPRSFRLRDLGFSSEVAGRSPALESLGLEELIGATPFKSANLKTNHSEPGVLSGMLVETMSKLEEKYHSGAFDAAAMPLVEQYIEEMRHLAFIQAERLELTSLRVSDIKEANEAAFNAVYQARKEREDRIRESSALIQEEQRLKHFKREQRKRNKEEAKALRKLVKSLERTEHLVAMRQQKQTRDQMRTAKMDDEARKAAASAAQQEATQEANIAQEELRRAETKAATTQAELMAAQTATSAAEEQLLRTYIELVEKELRGEQSSVIEAGAASTAGIQQLVDEQIEQLKANIEEMPDQESTPESDDADEPESTYGAASANDNEQSQDSL